MLVKRFAIVVFLAVSLVAANTFLTISGQAHAATISAVEIDRSTIIVGGTAAVLSETNITSFGPTLSDPATGLVYSVSAVIGGTTNAVDIIGLGFPPIVLLSGAIEDVARAAGLMQVLFRDAPTSTLYLLEVTDTILPANGAISVPATQAQVSVFAAEISPIPLPASGLLLIGALAAASFISRRRTH